MAEKAGGGYVPDERLAEKWRAAVSLVEQHLVAMQSLDGAGQLALMADEIEVETVFHESGLTDHADLRRRVGIAEVRAWLVGSPALVDVFKQLRLLDTVITPAADGNTVFVEARGDCIMADGQAYRNRYIFRYDVADGKITRLLEYHNPVTAAAPFGRSLPTGIASA